MKISARVFAFSGVVMLSGHAFLLWGQDPINVRLLGARGDCVADDTSYLEEAIRQSIASMKPIHLPQGCYGVTRTLEINRPATMPFIYGVPGGHGRNHGGGSVIRWIGAASLSSRTPIISIAGPTWGGGLRDLSIDGGNAINIYHLRIDQLNRSRMENVTLFHHGPGPSIEVTASSPGFCAGEMQWTNVRVTTSNKAGWSGILLDGYGTTSCSNTFIGGEFNFDSSVSGTYGVLLRGADNNLFVRTNFLSSSLFDANGSCSIVFDRWSRDPLFPNENTFIGVSVTNGICVHSQPVGPHNQFIGLHFGDCRRNCQIPEGPFNGFGNDGSYFNASFERIPSSLTDDAVKLRNPAGTLNYAGCLGFYWHNEDRAKICTEYFSGVSFYLRQPYGEAYKRWSFDPWGNILGMTNSGSNSIVLDSSGGNVDIQGAYKNRGLNGVTGSYYCPGGIKKIQVSGGIVTAVSCE
ncbi:MAG: hypothetical protein V2G41_09680 [bacterium JZ-2024 1]